MHLPCSAQQAGGMGTGSVLAAPLVLCCRIGLITARIIKEIKATIEEQIPSHGITFWMEE